MPTERADWLDVLLEKAPEWEPPAGFSMRVIAAAREKTPPLSEMPRQVRRHRLLLGNWWHEALFATLRGRVESAVWVLRQYLSLIGRG
jgi:hypothetical protein